MNKFYKVLIANRGETAIRLIRACKEIGIKTVAVYSTADRNSVHLNNADETICIGPPELNKSYLNPTAIISSALISSVDAIHPGFDLLAYDPRLIELCNNYEIQYFGPGHDTLDKLYDKLGLKRALSKGGVLTIPASDRFIETLEDAKKYARKLGYPVKLKRNFDFTETVARAIWDDNGLNEFWEEVSLTSIKSLEKMAFVVEKYFPDAKLIGVPTYIDSVGKISIQQEINFSIKHRNQYVLAESPSSELTSDTRKKLFLSSIRTAKTLNLAGVYILEFLIENHRNVYFFNIKPDKLKNLILEEKSRKDMVTEELLLKMGEKLGKSGPPLTSHSIECLIKAEDPDHNLCPSFGNINFCQLPGGVGVRVESPVYSGYTITPNTDPLLARIVVSAPSRKEALTKLLRCLKETSFEGIKTNIPFLEKLIQTEKYSMGDLSLNFFD